MPNNYAIRDISFRKTLSKLYFTKLNFICYNALNDLRYLNDIDFKDQIQNSQQMVYLIFGHPVHTAMVFSTLVYFLLEENNVMCI